MKLVPPLKKIKYLDVQQEQDNYATNRGSRTRWSPNGLFFLLKLGLWMEVQEIGDWSHWTENEMLSFEVYMIVPLHAYKQLFYAQMP